MQSCTHCSEQVTGARVLRWGTSGDPSVLPEGLAFLGSVSLRGSATGGGQRAKPLNGSSQLRRRQRLLGRPALQQQCRE